MQRQFRKFWIIENSLDLVLSLPEKLTDIFSSDIDSMYQNMDQNCVIEASSNEIRRAAHIVGADSFFVVIHNAIYGNKSDQVFWHNTTSGFNPVDHSLSCLKIGCSKGSVYTVDRIVQLLEFVVKHTYVTLGSSINHQVNGLPQGGHSSGHMANLTCHHYERSWVERFPWHSLQYAISRFMDDFSVANAPYFLEMYQDIYPPETGIRLLPNVVIPQPGRLIECKVLDTLIFVDLEGVVHVTLYDKRADYNFFVNRFPDIDSNASRAQSISAFYGEIVRLFRINTHWDAFLDNTADVAAYLIVHKRYPKQALLNEFPRFLSTQQGNPRLLGVQKDFKTMFSFRLHKCIEAKSTKLN
jgi:hypothetical protein